MYVDLLYTFSASSNTGIVIFIFIGDGTGVGKGRMLAGIILENFAKGREKAVWVTAITFVKDTSKLRHASFGLRK